MWNGTLGLDFSILCVSVMEVCQITGSVSIVLGSQPPQISLHEHFILLLYPKVPSNLLAFASPTQVIGNLSSFFFCVFFCFQARQKYKIHMHSHTVLLHQATVSNTVWPCHCGGIVKFRLYCRCWKSSLEIPLMTCDDFLREVINGLKCPNVKKEKKKRGKILTITNESVRGQTFI